MSPRYRTLQALIRSYEELISRKPLPILPPELHDYIIDYLHNKKHSLAACSLVCKAWVPSTRRHLFEYVVIRNSEINNFFALLASPLCTIATHVRRVSLYKADDVVLLCLAATITNVRHLALSSSYFSLGHFGAQGFKELSNLTLMDMEFHSMSELFNTLCTFHRLEGLLISNARTTFSTVSTFLPHANPVKPPALRQLWLTTSQTVQILEWLLRYPRSHHALSDFTVGVKRPGEVSVVAKFLHALGPSLEKLEIFQHTSELFTGPGAVNLSHNINLRVFSIHQRSLKSLGLVIPILSQINAPSIQKITIDYGSHLDRDVACWLTFQQYLVRLNLRSVILHAHEEDRVWITNQLPDLAMRHILKFTH